MEKKNYKQEILRLTGWTPERYDKEYDKYRLRVRQFERETGSKKINVSASFYYTKRDETRGKPLSPQKQAILNTPAYSQSKKNVAKRAKRKKKTAEEKRLEAYFGRRLSGLRLVNPKLDEFLKDTTKSWTQKQKTIDKYLKQLNQTQKARINKAREEIEEAEKDGRPADLDSVFEDYGDGNYEADFDFE